MNTIIMRICVLTFPDFFSSQNEERKQIESKLHKLCSVQVFDFQRAPFFTYFILKNWNDFSIQQFEKPLLSCRISVQI